MKLNKDEFRTLQQYWYKKLQESGFKDIEKLEGEEFVLIQSATYCFRHSDPFTREQKANYYRFMSQAVHDEETVFRNEVDKYILTRHAEGAKTNVILKELKEKGTPMYRNTIRFIVRRYEMLWGLREYEPKQLGNYIKRTVNGK